jgi:HAD superfamily hydrolase (TIGR01490 family)
MRAALFDMDRTLVTKETASLYVRDQMRRGEARLRDLLRVTFWAAQYTVGVLDAPVAAARAARSFAGKSEPAFAERCEDWFPRWVLPHVSARGQETVERHRARGDLLAIVTGAARQAAMPLARRLGIPHVVASELEVDGAACFTGRYVPPLCIGEGKVERTEELARSAGFELAEATFYTDSHTDLPLLERVAEPVVVNPDLRLSRIASRRGWRVERW